MMEPFSQIPVKPLYLFLDEGGNLDFSPSGSKYFSLTCVAKRRPFNLSQKMDTLKFDILEYGKDLQYFHCTDDPWPVRERTFNLLVQNANNCRVDCLIVEKAKTGPALQEAKKFYPRMVDYLVQHALKNCLDLSVSEVIVITDELPMKGKRDAVTKAIKQSLRNRLPSPEQKFRVLHFSSKSTYGLQIADYYNWAVFRKWELNDTRAYDLVKDHLSSEFDIFRSGVRQYY